jgi:DNA polymerase III subunit epsilon
LLVKIFTKLPDATTFFQSGPRAIFGLVQPTHPGTTVAPQPTTLSARAAQRLADGPLDSVTLMRDVCRVQRLTVDAAERMALALLGSRPEFCRLPSGHWAVREVAHRGSPQPDARVDGCAEGSHDAAGSATTSEACGSASVDVHRSLSGAASSAGLPGISFAVVDVETTGTRAGRGDRVTEIAIATITGGQITDVFVQLVNPERLIPPSITAITHITWEMVRDQPRFAAIAPQVTERLAGRIFTAHNAAFDWRFVSEELARGTGHQLHGPRLCTVRLARVLLPALSRRSLDHVTRYFGIAIQSRHRAEGDAVATAQVLLRMLDVASDRGVSSWEGLHDLVSPPAARRSRTASDRRRRAFPMPVTEDHVA